MDSMEFLLGWIGSPKSQRSVLPKSWRCFFVADDFLVHFGMIFKFRNSKKKSPDPWASNFVQVSSCFLFKLWRHNLFFKPLLETCWFSASPGATLDMTVSAAKNGWKWILPTAHLGPLGSLLLLISCLQTQHGLYQENSTNKMLETFFRLLSVGRNPKTTTNRLDVFYTTLVNYWEF